MRDLGDDTRPVATGRRADLLSVDADLVADPDVRATPVCVVAGGRGQLSN